ncbi:hypothetical protein [Chitinophaga rhizosphaerae]|uniref:hypothetical protein n=1 Tax=Chitinophaga rhizosphaerae TaxID=1864947 RepID=UPI000F80CFAF|nr:hypothetical protein [Chitinophaga rhizosphaerae]
MDEMLLNIISKDLHELREYMGSQNGLLVGIKTTLKKVETLDRTGDLLLKSLEKSSRDVDRLSQEIAGLRGLVGHLRQDLAKPLLHEHHNHFPKIIWITIGLFIGLAVAVSGWTSAWKDGLAYRNADTQIRYLRLLQEDSLYSTLRHAGEVVKADPEKVRDSVIQIEVDRERYWETIREAERLRRKGFGH